jgi:hypothetical protein
MTAITWQAAAGAIALAALLTDTAAAQGRGNGFGNGRNSRPSPAPSAVVAAAPGNGIRQFGSWLDDASVAGPGRAWTSVSVGLFTSTDNRQTNLPVIDAGIGLSRRAQFGISVPYYRVHFPDGTGAAGVGDVYMNAKIVLADPGARGARLGVAMTPVLEASTEPMPGANRFSWAVPISIEARRDRYRVFGSTGFFSRGAVFASAAYERPFSTRAAWTASATYMRSVQDDLAADQLGMPKSRFDVGGTTAYFVTPALSVFAGTGRTIGSAGSYGTSFMLAGGMSVAFTPRPVRPGR